MLYVYNKHLDDARAAGVCEVHSNGDVVYVWRWRVSVMVTDAHHEEIIAWYFGDLQQFKTL